jgi:hypothetical protein
MAFSASPFEKRGFQMAPIFNGLQPWKMAVRPCTVRPVEKHRFSTGRQFRYSGLSARPINELTASRGGTPS